MQAAKIQNYFELYQKRRGEVLNLAKEQAEIVQVLALDKAQAEGDKPGEILQGLIRRLETDSFRVLVIGKFSAGKSTFINALFGQVVLPASPAPTTGVLCEVKYADESEKRARLYPKPGFGRNGGSEPFDVRISNLKEELGKYVKIDHFGDTNATSRYEKLELFWPLTLCKNGIELIDSVGLDDPEAREEVTMKYARQADAILYCMKSQDTYTAKDKQVLGTLRGLGFDSIFFVITFYNHIRESEQLGQTSQQEFRNLQARNLSQWTELKERGIKYVDSGMALGGYLQGNGTAVEDSGIRDVEASLETFLTQDKGRAKLVTTLRSLRSVNRVVRTIIPMRIGMAQATGAELEERYQKAQLPLKNMEQTRQLMIGTVERGITEIGWQARDLAEKYFLELRRNKVQQWAEAHEFETGLGFPPSVKPLVTELIEHLREKIEADVAEWGSSVLQPMVVERVTALEKSLENYARSFAERARDVRIQLSVGADMDTDAMAKQHEPSLGGRALGLGFAILTGDVVTGATGMFLGPKGMMRTIMYQIVAGIILVILNLLNPFAIIAAAIAAAVAGGFHNIFNLKRQIKKTVGEKFAAKLDEMRPELCNAVRAEVERQLQSLKTDLDKTLAGELASLRGEVERAIKDKQSGQQNTNREIHELRQMEERNSKLERNIEDWMFEFGISV